MEADLRVELPPDVETFLERAGDFLAAHEAENNLLFGISSNLRADPMMYGDPPRFAVVAEAAGRPGRVVAASLRTPPHNLVLAHVEELRAVDALADALAGDPLPGVVGPTVAAHRFAEQWTARSGRRPVRAMAERIFRLSAVRLPRPAAGRMRSATVADRALITAWLQAFTEEALAKAFEDAGEAADRWIAGGGRTLQLWQDGDRTVSLCGVGGATPNGTRIGPVYTLPEHRGHGYASNLVARASQAELDAGRRFVFLLTDLANPTSNKIYQAIGYEPVADVDVYAFEG